MYKMLFAILAFIFVFISFCCVMTLSNSSDCRRAASNDRREFGVGNVPGQAGQHNTVRFQNTEQEIWAKLVNPAVVFHGLPSTINLVFLMLFLGTEGADVSL
jgi:hypothetical protein